ncbi:MazG nucleotide pyrophosphohydrolase domain-containing protein [Vibrio hippocampi]|uniref:NTP pyrophosphohydrolase MazG-like domain-containing protein n=1 Tax=Vibrio hippocampi TaxID=654686 RepID=A0ABM8ZNF2_9VIBR|nr:MazG nucleotide pyrophosphohydrolase domain-containing protein [Vibrio hippocampi]CAH0530091.1 hypothetical protein VHP8226_03819 [Vibrio hippocampi]
MNKFATLINIAKRKSVIDETSNWSNGSSTYLQEIVNEVDEVIEEIPKQRTCYLETELGDVLWDYLNMVIALEKEQGISLESVLARACEKYDERVSGIENGVAWEAIKKIQNQKLAEEQLTTLARKNKAS